jgi:hypothetical protein
MCAFPVEQVEKFNIKELTFQFFQSGSIVDRQFRGYYHS